MTSSDSSRLVRRLGVAILATLAGLATADVASARLLGLGHHASPKAPPLVTDTQLAQIQRALDEERYLDAARMLEAFSIAGVRDPRLIILNGDLSLARGQYDDALSSFKEAETFGDYRAASYEGQGIAMAQLGRSNEAMAMLTKAVTANPAAWRAWNALGGEYDAKHDWTDAETAYDHALSDSDSAPVALNNRGFSRLMQSRLDDAVADFVAALGKKPDFSAARTNLRLAMAMKGEYDRATAGGAPDDQASLLNNAGFAAILRGDYAKAEDLLNQAMKAKGEYYGRASDNLTLARSLAAHGQGTPSADH
jgi:Flp pilus assembly protein TadD